MGFGKLGARGGFGSLGVLGTVPQPPAGFAWVTYLDPVSGQNQIITYTDPSTGAVRPVMASLIQ